MIKNGCGRRQESQVWQYFKYDAVGNQTKCTVIDDSGEACKVVLIGKNPSNMKAHLGRAHKSELNACTKNDESLRLEKKAKTMPQSSVKCSTGSAPAPFFNKHIMWPPLSNEQLNRERDLTDWFIETGLPVRIVEGESFRKIYARLDPKFSLPGRLLSHF